MLSFAATNEFDRDMKRMARRHLDLDLLQAVLDLLLRQQPLPEARHDHALSGQYRGFRECHIAPDWLLIYYVEADRLVAARTGSHADLFD
ncbi:MAG: type II toxin-antitoxin system YafQ family toxin [Propionibacteriaceae bacterium]|nr:type II toxin-antitoxin system YafQ family toxin [Propionibacteriaceae bacterium]